MAADRNTATVRRVTADWAAAFPGFTVWRGLRLVRRIGPVVQGICLDRTTADGYFPTAHVHALTRDFPVISLTLGHRLRGPSGQPQAVPFLHHERDFEDAVDAMRAQSQLSLAGPPTVEEIVREYHASSVTRQERGHSPAVVEMEDAVLVAAAVGRHDLVAEGLALAADLAGRWPKGRLPLDWVSTDAWLQGLRAKADHPAALADTVNGQAASHKLPPGGDAWTRTTSAPVPGRGDSRGSA